MSINCITRFAPSPTGRLHLGHAYSALQSYDFARQHGGRFLLRIEDIDQGRCRAEFVDGILYDLQWLGLNWDGDVVFQSQRGGLYAEALDRLKSMGLVYRCTCTRAEIAASAGAPQGDMGPIYPGTCRHKQHVADERPYCWRLNIERALDAVGPLGWDEKHLGPIQAKPKIFGDVVMARKDADTSYHLAVVVDDASQGVTHVIRGSDLFEATHVHRLLQALLNLPTPQYHHHQLLVDEEGNRLAKRRDSISLGAMRAAGMDPKDVVKGLRDGPFPVGLTTEFCKEG